MATDRDWWLAAGCRELTATQVDALFFPGSGGKPKKAEAFCSKKCAVMDMCLRKAIEGDLDGFFAGTTKDQRRVMAKHYHITPNPVTDLIPEEPKRRRVYRKIVTEVQDTLTYLDSLEGPSPLEAYGIAL